MNHFARATALCTLAAALAAHTSAAHAKSCVMAGGTATMITEDLAKFMAEAALKNSISGMSAKAEGKMSMSCKAETGLTNCTAKQKACK
jgi:hypothetical protein